MRHDTEIEGPFRLSFGSGRTSLAVRLDGEGNLQAAVAALGLDTGRPTIVVVGGAGELDDPRLSELRPLFTGAIAPMAHGFGACVIDGGTDAGVMRLMGDGHEEVGGGFPLVGVAAEGTVAFPGAVNTPGNTERLEARHTHFVLVPGDVWGDETPWIVRVANVIAGEAPSVTVLVDGGDVAQDDVAASIEAGRRVIAVAGTGRAADSVASAAQPGLPGRLSTSRGSSLIVATEASSLADELARELTRGAG
jgi:hypothetical protein